MPEHPKLRKILGAVFPIETGLSDAAQTAMLQRSLQNPEWRAAFQQELYSAASDPQTLWLELLLNNEYEVTDADSEIEAREIAMSLLWQTTFPGQSIPQI